MSGKRTSLLLLTALATFHVAVLLAGFVSPYDVELQERDLVYAPPSRLHFVDNKRKVHLIPFACSIEILDDVSGGFAESCAQIYPVRLFVRGAQYTILGLFVSNVHLFGVDAPARLFLMGTDGYGRDVFSRFIYGGQISLFAGLLATLLSLTFGTTFGLIAGYYGGWTDLVIMRLAELFVAVPWLYLLFAVRASLPLSLRPSEAFLLLVTVIGSVGWARPAKLVRAVALGSKERHCVFAARLFGGSDAYVIRRHILPDAYQVIVTQATLLIPQYILAEVVLSFLGLGVGEPTPSWGNMLSVLHQYSVLVSHWWMLLPGVVLAPLFLGYSLLADGLRLGQQSRCDETRMA
jgi:peptide/nickel transport system permease protein